ncbi:hypothetical protein R3P38DRAFT_3367618 [Favolaschia claudopus]|uniref:Uncharacterized protein n=1 Tax=Favolaschia claudopus TaxID=2862362 RepID=A0AAW0A8Q6_9AGAR
MIEAREGTGVCRGGNARPRAIEGLPSFSEEGDSCCAFATTEDKCRRRERRYALAEERAVNGNRRMRYPWMSRVGEEETVDEREAARIYLGLCQRGVVIERGREAPTVLTWCASAEETATKRTDVVQACLLGEGGRSGRGGSGRQRNWVEVRELGCRRDEMGVYRRTKIWDTEVSSSSPLWILEGIGDEALLSGMILRKRSRCDLEEEYEANTMDCVERSEAEGQILRGPIGVCWPAKLYM